MLIRTDTLQPWDKKRLANGVLYSRNIEALWTDAELLEIGLVRTIYFVTPLGYRTTGTPTYDATGQQTFTTELIPPPTPKEIAEHRERATIDILDENPVLGKILFALAKQARPATTPSQFAAWVRGLA